MSSGPLQRGNMPERGGVSDDGHLGSIARKRCFGSFLLGVLFIDRGRLELAALVSSALVGSEEGCTGWPSCECVQSMANVCHTKVAFGPWFSNHKQLL